MSHYATEVCKCPSFSYLFKFVLPAIQRAGFTLSFFTSQQSVLCCTSAFVKFLLILSFVSICPCFRCKCIAIS